MFVLEKFEPTVVEKRMNFVQGDTVAEVKAHDSYDVCINQEKENLYWQILSTPENLIQYL